MKWSERVWFGSMNIDAGPLPELVNFFDFATTVSQRPLIVFFFSYLSCKFKSVGTSF